MEAKVRPKTQDLYSSIGQVLRYGYEDKDTVLATAIWTHDAIPDWFNWVCKRCNIRVIEKMRIVDISEEVDFL